jgi:hypothetical protein
MTTQINEIRKVLTALKEDQATFSAAVNRVPACDKGLKAVEEIELEQEGDAADVLTEEPEPETESESTLPWPVDENGEPDF